MKGETEVGAMICDFGKKQDGYNLYRINGDLKQVEDAIQKIKDVGCEVLPSYEIERVRGFEFTVLIKVFVPVEEEKVGNENEAI